MLQIRCPYRAICPDIYTMCFNRRETHNHLFLHCEVAWKLWIDVFKLFGLVWVLPPTVNVYLWAWAEEGCHTFVARHSL